jgi:hypothetical protein
MADAASEFAHDHAGRLVLPLATRRASFRAALFRVQIEQEAGGLAEAVLDTRRNEYPGTPLTAGTPSSLRHNASF